MNLFKHWFAAWVLMLAPLFFMAYLTVNDGLGADPAKKLALLSGEWTLRFLLLTLSISTLGRLYNPLRQLIRFRRLLGIWTFCYASLHLFVFIALYLNFDFYTLQAELIKRPYIAVGFIAWLLMIPLAATSNHQMVRRLGLLLWRRLHRVVYLAVLLAVAHVAWQIRADWFDAFFYGMVAGLLLMERLWAIRKGK